MATTKKDDFAEFAKECLTGVEKKIKTKFKNSKDCDYILCLCNKSGRCITQGKMKNSTTLRLATDLLDTIADRKIECIIESADALRSAARMIEDVNERN